jgi:hypothetical protein
VGGEPGIDAEATREALQEGLLVARIGLDREARGLDVYVTSTQPAPCPAGADVCRKAQTSGVQFGMPRGKLAQCASACTKILAAGTRRSVGPTALVGVHQAAYYDRSTGDGTGKVTDRKIPEAVYVKFRDYFVEMGIDATVMLRLLGADHKTMHWLTRTELTETRIANHNKSGEELITGRESDDWLVTSSKAARMVAKATAASDARSTAAPASPAAAPVAPPRTIPAPAPSTKGATGSQDRPLAPRTRAAETSGSAAAPRCKDGDQSSYANFNECLARGRPFSLCSRICS